MADEIDPKKVVKTVRSVLEEQDRLTVNVATHHQCLGEQPISQVWNKGILLTTKHQPYHRRLSLKMGESALLLGDIPREDVGYILIENTSGRGLTQNPTEQEKATISRQVVQVVTGDGYGWDIRPGEIFLARPNANATIRLIVAENMTKITYTVYPK